MAEWHRWLIDHHAEGRGIWLETDRKGPACRTPDYGELLDEAICHGWIDARVRGRDATTYLVWWTPRRARSHWTDANLGRARTMSAAGRMTPAGLAVLPAEVRAELT